MKTYMLIGSRGFAINLFLNLLALFALHRPAAVFFSEQWYGDWFPLYVVWLSFIVIGWVGRRGMKARR